MTTSGTYAFNPTAAEVFAAALGICGVRRTDISQQHIVDASFQANMIMVDFSNRNPNQWALETQTIALATGLNSYNLTSRTIAIATAYISITVGSDTTDRVISAMSAAEYAAIPNKAQQGFPNSYWVNLQTPIPTIKLYFTPDSAHTYTLNLVTFRQMQDVVPVNGQTLDAPYRFLDAFHIGLAARLSLIYPDSKRPNLPQQLDALYEKRLLLASATDQEDVNIYVTPGLQGYFRMLPMFFCSPALMYMLDAASR